jgi:cell division protein FtsL
MKKKKKQFRSPLSIGIGVLLVLILMGELLFYTWCRVQCIKTGYKITAEQKRNKELINLQKNLRVELANLKSPDRIGRIARERLGLIMPEPGQIIVIP